MPIDISYFLFFLKDNIKYLLAENCGLTETNGFARNAKALAG